MRNRFVRTSNVDLFLASMAQVEERGAPEASILLVGGNAGFGKSRTGTWWHIQNDSVMIRMKAAYTPKWAMSDLCSGLGEPDVRGSTMKLFGTAVGSLARNPKPIVVDEVEYALQNDIKALEILRDVSDTVDVPLILLGREFVYKHLERHRQLYTRISGYAEFLPASLDDVQLCVEELCEVPVAEEVIARIAAESEGHIREIVKAIANVERVGKRNKDKTVTLDLIQGRPLCRDWLPNSRKAA